MKNKLIGWLLIGVAVLNVSHFVLNNKKYFTRVFDPDYYGRLYSESQYVKGKLSKGGIGDDGLYAFAGYYYLIQKGDVSAVNFEHPPLGKYLIGLSELLFKNENVINLIYFFFLLLLVYHLGLRLSNNLIISGLAVLFLSLNNLILDNLLRSLLDLPFSLFFTAAVYFFLLGLKQEKYHYLSGLFWGLAFSTRFFPALVLIYPLYAAIIVLRRKSQLAIFCKSVMSVPIIYLISHFSFFLYHPSLMEFIRHKKWMLSWFSGTVTDQGNIWRNIYTGSYIGPSGKLTVDGHWSPVLPLVVTLGILNFGKQMFKKGGEEYLAVYLLVILYFFYVTFLTLGLQKFIMPIYPLLTVMAAQGFGMFYSIIMAWLKRISWRSKTK